jgi:hypothetical protein
MTSGAHGSIFCKAFGDYFCFRIEPARLSHRLQVHFSFIVSSNCNGLTTLNALLQYDAEPRAPPLFRLLCSLKTGLF